METIHKSIKRGNLKKKVIKEIKYEKTYLKIILPIHIGH